MLATYFRIFARKVILLVAVIATSGCFTVRARMAGRYTTTKGSEGSIGIEKSFPVYKDATACGMSAILLGGWCWAYLFMPRVDQQDEMYELADELLAKNVGSGKYRLQGKNVRRIGYYKAEPTLKLVLNSNKGDVKDTDLFDGMQAAEELGQVSPPTHPDERALHIPTWSGEAGIQLRMASSFFVGAMRREMGYHVRFGTEVGNEQLILGLPLIVGGGYRKGLFSVFSSFSLFADGGFRGIVYEKGIDEVVGKRPEGFVCQRELPCRKGVEIERNANWTMLFYDLSGRISTPNRYPLQGFFEAGASWNLYTRLAVSSKPGDEAYGNPLGIGSLYYDNYNGIGFNGRYAGQNVVSPLIRAGLSVDFR